MIREGASASDQSQFAFCSPGVVTASGWPGGEQHRGQAVAERCRVGAGWPGCLPVQSRELCLSLARRTRPFVSGLVNVATFGIRGHRCL